ncbi:putative serine/threonine-protein kinase PIX13 [Heracleum sosnowskyi]|uniref:Serine/threonine-protein kinase PIX13 n=1 Tax=Heracleum sosnowskyi TaxID=360622 RepID=A0AAD8HQ66_9APIA|nr:putative serine/threonine-protein kinase PIX13 [Heracleum sosnowskyi]
MGNSFRSPGIGLSAYTKLPTASVYSSSGNDVQLNQESTGTIVNPNLKIFTLGQLKRATRNFRPSSMVGEGGFGRVYKGWVDEKTLAPSKIGVGIPVAIRKSDPCKCKSLGQWKAEVEFLGKFSHPNIVKLLGYYRDDKQFLLVYEYMNKGSLENHLFRNGAGQLSWKTRVKIAMGAAHGLAFLHATNKQVTCRFFQTANILLDEEFNAKLSDFGKVKLEADVVGVEGDCNVDSEHRSSNDHRKMGRVLNFKYSAPEYGFTGSYSNEGDVYSFGIILLEMITGTRAFDRSRPLVLVAWAKPYLHKKDTLKKVMDPKLQGRYPVKAAFETAALILKCLQHSRKDRPSMNDVFRTLELINAMNMAP